MRHPTTGIMIIVTDSSLRRNDVEVGTVLTDKVKNEII